MGHARNSLTQRTALRGGAQRSGEGIAEGEQKSCRNETRHDTKRLLSQSEMRYHHNTPKYNNNFSTYPNLLILQQLTLFDTTVTLIH